MSANQQNQNNACGGCSSCGAHLAALGLNINKFDYIVALAGNPNTGKSTVFNALTGLRQHTGNWPGKTVTRAEGGFQYNEKRYKIVDLPGTYSLLSMSEDEEIARNFILFGQPHCTIIVVDATCLERNLNLTLQILEITGQAVVALNLMDEAKRKQIEIDHRQLARDLGVPVVPIVAKTKEGFSTLLEEMAGVIRGDILTKPHRIKTTPALEDSISKILPEIQRAYPKLPNPRWICLRLLDGDARVREALLNNEFTGLAAN